MEALLALKSRRSIRSYKTDPLPAPLIEDIVDCGRLAATARNIQPWEFIIVTDSGMRQQLAALIPNGPFISQAPVCIVVVCRDTKYYLEDGCAAIENLLLAGHAHGLGSCWVAGDKKPYAPQINQILGVPASYKLIGLVAIGYAAELPPTPPKRALTEVIHREKF